MSPLRCFILPLIALCLVGLSLRAATPLAKSDDPPARTDHYGDPLPEGAVARLGTLRFRHETGSIGDWAISADGQMIVTVHEVEKTLCFWEAKTGKELRRIEGDFFTTLAFSGKGNLLVVETARRGSNLLLFDATSGKELHRFEGHDGRVKAVAFANGDKEVISVTEFGELRWWDAASGKLLREWHILPPVDPKLKRKRYDVLESVRFSGDGKAMATCTLREPSEKPLNPDSGDVTYSVEIWDLENRKELSVERGLSRSARAFGLSSRGDRLALGVFEKDIALGVFEKDIALHEVRTGGPLLSLVCPDESGARRLLAFSPDGKTLATATRWGPVRVWDTASGKLARTFAIGSELCEGLLFSPDGKRLFVDNRRTISVLDVSTGKDLLPWEGHHRGVKLLGFTADGRRLRTAISSNVSPIEVITWNTATWRPAARWTDDNPRLERALAISLDHTLAAKMTPGEKVSLLDVTTEKDLRLFEGTYAGFRREGRFSPGNQFLVLEMEDNANYFRLFFDVRSGKRLGEIPAYYSCQLVFSPDEGRVAWLGGNDNRFYVAEIPGLKPRAMDGAPIFGNLRPAMAFSPEGDYLASWKETRSGLMIWRVATGKESSRLPTENVRRISLAWSPTGHILAIGRETDKGTTIDLCEPFTGLVRHTFPGHRAKLASLAFSPDGRYLVSGSEDTTALVWDVYGSTGKAPRVLTLDSLGDNNGKEAHAAVSYFIQQPDQAIPLLREKLVPAVKPKAERVKELWANLDHDDFTVRSQSARSLSEMGDLAAPYLKEFLAVKPSPEQRRQAEGLLKALDEQNAPSPVVLRSLRGIEALEVIATPEARDVLAGLAKGAEESRQTREAKSALKRLTRREGKP